MTKLALVLLAAAAATGAGCGGSHKTLPLPTNEPGPAESHAAPDPAAAAAETKKAAPVDKVTWVLMPKARVEVAPPKGWKEGKVKDWTVFKAATGHGAVGFVEVDGDPGKMMASIADTFEVASIHWTPVHNEALGQDQLPGRVSDGTCSLKDNNPADVTYGIVKADGPSSLLIVYVSDTQKAGKAARIVATDSIKLMRVKH